MAKQPTKKERAEMARLHIRYSTLLDYKKKVKKYNAARARYIESVFKEYKEELITAKKAQNKETFAGMPEINISPKRSTSLSGFKSRDELHKERKLLSKSFMAIETTAQNKEIGLYIKAYDDIIRIMYERGFEEDDINDVRKIRREIKGMTPNEWRAAKISGKFTSISEEYYKVFDS